jgi:hypothetical protein
VKFSGRSSRSSGSSPVSRRSLLGLGLGGGTAAVLSPFIPLLERQAEAQGLPRRLVLFFWSGGTSEQYLPTGTETSFQFQPLLSPLDAWKQKLIVFGNLRRSQDNSHGSHQAGTSGVWTAARMLGPGPTGWVSHPSIDRVITKMVPQPTSMQTLDLDVQSQDPSNLRGNTMYDTDLQPVHGEQDPSRAFDRLFTNGIIAPLGADPKLGDMLRARRRSVLDFVRQDLTALNSRLGGQDRRKLDQHLDNIRVAEMRLSAPVGGTGGIPGYTPPTADSIPKLDFKANDNFPVVGKAHMELLVAALASDRTRIVNAQWSQGNGDIVYRWVGVQTAHHALTHRGDSAPGLDNIRKYYYTQFADLLAKMDSIKEGNGSLLDNTVIVFANEFVSGASHDTDPWPVILAGGGGGHFKTGRFLAFPPQSPSLPRLFPGADASAAAPSQTQLLTSICHYMGAMVPRVGDPMMGPDGPLPGLV